MATVVIHCPASKGYCDDEYDCENCQKFDRCLQKGQKNRWRRNRNEKCFLCKYLKAVTMGVECGKKKDR